MSAEGTWSVTMNTPMGAQPGTLTLKEDGDSLSGSLSGAQGTQEFEGGKVDGNSLSWTVSMTQPMPMKLEFTATVDGDEISGDIDIEAFGKATFTGTRA